MRKKLISKTYLRDVEKYKIMIDFSNGDFYVCVKKMIKTEPFIIETGLHLIDNNYYIVEVIPKNENYTMRVFISDKREILEHYFDITLENVIDEETKIPYYDDLFTDVIIKKDGRIVILDEDELAEALEKGEISSSDYNLANETTKKLVKSIKENNNRYMHIDLNKYLNMID